MSWQIAFDVVRYLGAVYLIYLGVRLMPIAEVGMSYRSKKTRHRAEALATTFTLLEAERDFPC